MRDYLLLVVIATLCALVLQLSAPRPALSHAPSPAHEHHHAPPPPVDEAPRATVH